MGSDFNPWRERQRAAQTSVNVESVSIPGTVSVTGTVTATGPLTNSEFSARVPDTAGTWGYNAGTSGTVALTGSKRVLQITAVALGAAGTITINGGDTITLPYDATDKASTSITITPVGNLTDPTIVFTGTDAFFVEHVT